MNTKREIVLRGAHQKDIIKYFMGVVEKEENKSTKMDSGKQKSTKVDSDELIYDLVLEKDVLDRDNSSKDVHISGHLWQVHICEEKVVCLGSLSFPEVKIIVTGETYRVTQLVFDFRIEFLTAGG